MTVAELITELSKYQPDAEVRICTEWPRHRSIETVELPGENITAPCVAIYA